MFSRTLYFYYWTVKRKYCFTGRFPSGRLHYSALQSWCFALNHLTLKFIWDYNFSSRISSNNQSCIWDYVNGYNFNYSILPESNYLFSNVAVNILFTVPYVSPLKLTAGPNWCKTKDVIYLLEILVRDIQ